MISDSLQKQIQEAFKSGDELRTTTLKLLSAALHNAEIAKIGKLTEEEEIVIVQREIKKRSDAIVLYKQGGAIEKAKREEDETAILSEFLPEQMTPEALEKIIDEAIAQTGASTISDMGKVMALVKQQVGAQAPGATIAESVKRKLA